jgi:hypothetical protein
LVAATHGKAGHRLLVGLELARARFDVLLRENDVGLGRDFVVDDRLVVLADDIDAEFLRCSSRVRWG